MCYVEQRPEVSKRTIALPKIFTRIVKMALYIRQRRKQKETLKRLSNEMLKDIGYSQSEICNIKSERNLIDPLSLESHKTFRK